MKKIACVFVLWVLSNTAFGMGGVMSTVVPSETAKGGKGDGRFYHLKYPSLGNHTHFGVDIWDYRGSPVMPAFDGEVIGFVLVGDGKHEDFGNAIMLKHPQIKDEKGRTLHSIYLHFDYLSEEVKQIGKKVYAGETVLGGMGTTGEAGEIVHTHLELRWFGEWTHPKALGCKTGKSNIYACGDAGKKQWAKEDWEDPETFTVSDPIPTPEPPAQPPSDLPEFISVARFQDTAWTPSTVSCREATTWYKAHTTSNGVKLYNYGSQSCATWRIPVGCRVGDCLGHEVTTQVGRDFTDQQANHLPEPIREIAMQRPGGNPNDYIGIVRPDGYEVQLFSTYEEKGVPYKVFTYTGSPAEHDFYFNMWMTLEHFVFWNIQNLRNANNLAPGTVVSTIPLTNHRPPIPATEYTCRDHNGQVRYDFSPDCTATVKLYVSDW